ncbi:phosphoribosylglycinamide formyltransferase [Ornithinibacillus halophilus]|uniref:Phosphoribosylglycinamide formyltransferase n=1 Tax=Ornithinibacillus halophilus TaxID=930117 RepID=A0A1M5ET81_9BACI|nr:phosphoribosylglycinamide formyltransferase [Ornithinibacillus halophilus]SHF82331.1 formyltetrahydrofolate-dependent phosphoribosylglycinamide formyltransferase [Ornithinibacillus halophilus]
MSKVRAAVFASGTGSNFQAMMETENLACEITLLVCDKPGASVLEKAKRFNVPTIVFDPNMYSTKEEYELEVLHVLKEAKIDWIFLAGYMRIVGPTLLQAYDGKMMNIHPSLLPQFPGKDAIGQAFRAGVETTGVTVHYIDEGIDTGPIIDQVEIKVHKNDTKESLQKRIQEVEHQLYPAVINDVLSKGVKS